MFYQAPAGNIKTHGGCHALKATFGACSTVFFSSPFCRFRRSSSSRMHFDSFRSRYPSGAEQLGRAGQNRGVTDAQNSKKCFATSWPVEVSLPSLLHSRLAAIDQFAENCLILFCSANRFRLTDSHV
ncbi:hypothetical protein [Bradyrhizobium australiense]|uniref:Uncharacterized protein n=1 Tax=Bradyrhizobium australiense TaxID=2721161 RepID=A0A7Y4GXE8_9BRAD|nr:hypothetical protein [Bradyrhizobium australiense]NOJ43720.1 hypothetical protein [Bradyrhizobium australiense]